MKENNDILSSKNLYNQRETSLSSVIKNIMKQLKKI